MTSLIEYDFVLSLEQCKYLYNNSREKTSTCRHLGGNYWPMFTKEMERVEEQVLQLHPTNAVIYPGKRRQNVAFVTINAHCKRCKEANQPHKYTCVIKENCLDGNRPCATVHVTHDQHQHVTSSQSGDDNSVASTASSSTDNRSNSSSSSSGDSNGALETGAGPKQLRGDERTKVKHF